VETISATHALLHFSGDPEHVRDLAARETECCSFFRFTVTDSTLDVEVPDRYADVLAALVTRVS
jgi:thymidylate synthase